jgi:MFS family permease
MFACYTISSVLVRLRVGSASDRHGPHRIIPSALLVQASGVGLFALLARGESWILIATGLIAGAGHGILYPALSALCVERLGPAARGTALALVTSWIDLGSFAGSTLSGVLAQNLGYPLMFCAVALVVMTSGLVFPAVDRPATGP